MKILVNGAGGQLGQEIVHRLSPWYDILGYTREEWDVTDSERTRELLKTERPDVVVHCAAYTKVDEAEDDPVSAFRINTYGTRNVATACSENDAVMVYFSTDYVFDGERVDGYDEWSETSPVNVYGRSKEAGERTVRLYCPKHFILRTSWLYGVHGHNFVKTIVNKARATKEIRVVNDQTGSPTYAGHLVSKLTELLHTRNYSTYHAANSGSCTWFQFARTIIELLALNVTPVPISTCELQPKAKRPRYSTLRSVRLPAQNIALLPHWEAGVSEFLKQWEGERLG